LPADTDPNIADLVTEISERASLLVREEIELAKAEITEKIKRLMRGVVAGAVGGIFLLGVIIYGLHGVAWFLYWALPIGTNTEFFWGFFALALILLILGLILSYVAYRLVRKAAPPTPNMAIDEARKIRETVSPGDGKGI
jgi:Putative Actinobacterial Holin-X, holin superfamily III